jgi:hypothetical protein
MTALRLVIETGRGNSPILCLLVGFAGFVAIWASYGKERLNNNGSVWAALGISAICTAFIYVGLRMLLR